jgi:undecaprenyl diphosphate synthase
VIALNSHKTKIKHVAIIMDGNGRWAAKKNISKKKGHEYGVLNCIKICENLKKLDFKINEISFYVFSTENWNRSPVEIRNLFKIIEAFYISFKTSANQNNISVRHYGSKQRLTRKINKIINDVVLSTKKNNGTYVNKKKFNFRDYLYIPESNDPDLIIRTGGEIRLSNFMLWQSAYSELYFTKTLWPDFKITSLNKILHSYLKRNRKHGK